MLIFVLEKLRVWSMFPEKIDRTGYRKGGAVMGKGRISRSMAPKKLSKLLTHRDG